MSVRNPRPWYVIDALCDGYLSVATNGGNLHMLQALKIVRGITLNVIIGLIAVIMVLEGGDPTVIGGIALIGLMVVNGVELTDYLAAKQALEEATQEAGGDE